MALTTKKIEPSGKVIQEQHHHHHNPPTPETIILELALYVNYTYNGKLYVKGTGYRFKRGDAINLLSERDFGRPIWKIFRVEKPVPKREVIVDSTEDEVHTVAEPIPGTVEPTRQTRIEVGDDSELADLGLNGESEEVVGEEVNHEDITV